MKKDYHVHAMILNEAVDSEAYIRQAIAAAIEAGFEAQINAIAHSPYPAMLGHFLIAHTKPGRAYTWFAETKIHLPLMKAQTAKLLETCRRTHSMVDLTGLHLLHCKTMQQQRRHDGLLYGYQRGVVQACQELGIPAAPGSDAHQLSAIKESRLFDGYWEES